MEYGPPAPSTHTAALFHNASMNDSIFWAWTDEYLLRIPAIDEEHRQIIAIFNRLADSLETRVDRGSLMAVFNEFLSFYRRHVSTEERLLAENNYIGLEKQKRDHAAFVKYMEALSHDLAGGSLQLNTGILKDLQDRIASHFIGPDRAYGEYLKTQGML